MALILHRNRVVDTETGKIYGIEVATHVDSSGYRQVYLPGGKTQQAHRFVWEAAHGPIPPDMEINHLNGDKADNRLSNLELTTRLGNILHAFRTGLASNAGVRHPGARLTNIRVLAIRALADHGVPHKQLARNAGISRRQVNDIARRRSWTHLPDLPVKIEDL